MAETRLLLQSTVTLQSTSSRTRDPCKSVRRVVPPRYQFCYLDCSDSVLTTTPTVFDEIDDRHSITVKEIIDIYSVKELLAT